MNGGADFDSTERYRYRLWREWDDTLPRAVFAMLNPSTADAHKNDPTISRCIAYARLWGYGSMEAVNLFSYRATDPRRLRQVDDPIGPLNDEFLFRAVESASLIVVAWGNHGSYLRRSEQVMERFSHRDDLYCLGITRSGQPHHPLHLARSTPLLPYPALR